MSRIQRLVRLVIRLLMPVMVLGAIGAIAGTLAATFEAQKDIASVRSPDGRYTATLVYGFNDCADTPSFRKDTVVYVERRWAVFKTGIMTPFCLAGAPDRVVLRWENVRTLRIDCHGCHPNSFEYAETNWGDLRFIFDLDQP